MYCIVIVNQVASAALAPCEHSMGLLLYKPLVSTAWACCSTSRLCQSGSAARLQRIRYVLGCCDSCWDAVRIDGSNNKARYKTPHAVCFGLSLVVWILYDAGGTCIMKLVQKLCFMMLPYMAYAVVSFWAVVCAAKYAAPCRCRQCGLLYLSLEGFTCPA
jgi:hypothetical protein